MCIRDSVYGGQVLAQSIVAAYKTIDDDKVLHSIHSYFINPGDNDKDISFRVEVIKDGRSFNTRRVVASQEAVSYTHLDVYKRQLYTQVFIFSHRAITSGSFASHFRSMDFA